MSGAGALRDLQERPEVPPSGTMKPSHLGYHTGAATLLVAQALVVGPDSPKALALQSCDSYQAHIYGRHPSPQGELHICWCGSLPCPGVYTQRLRRASDRALLHEIACLGKWSPKG